MTSKHDRNSMIQDNVRRKIVTQQYEVSSRRRGVQTRRLLHFDSNLRHRGSTKTGPEAGLVCSMYQQ